MICSSLCFCFPKIILKEGTYFSHCIDFTISTKNIKIVLCGLSSFPFSDFSMKTHIKNRYYTLQRALLILYINTCV